ncbi:hypothetical protein GQF61_07675 [Sphingobacterium sp. DK4209]|uniref:Methylamine utilisation protein MauE domain-containing protein n=1 Tax=Sphingobacterium zhuxiongii TaxID=2662364 RepID=A0A5Q0QEF8_9SPHI|nr:MULTISPECIES: MauE/DoxX family redox-associated membrane protein [unclassified Sphingobacterium]MVZ65734.1 hypothetical protein [Sphingobacterium sp. DK4209]QGA27933.1 hypothetical protein GFH32_17070 [Sphingobacterium sp. dk4302]
MKKEKFTAILSGTIALMLFYAASTKLFNYQQAQASMQKQIFSRSIADLLTWLIPSIEFIISMLLIYTRTRIVGLWASISLLAVFTGYLLLAMSRIFGYRPCSCGGIIQQLSYGEHLVFNLVFLFLSLIALYLKKKQTQEPRTLNLLPMKKLQELGPLLLAIETTITKVIRVQESSELKSEANASLI